MLSRTERRRRERRERRRRRLLVFYYSFSFSIIIGCIFYFVNLIYGFHGWFGKNAVLPVVPSDPPSSAPVSTSTFADKEISVSTTPSTTPSPFAPSVVFHFVGDVMFAGNVADLLARHGYDYPYRHVRGLLDAADVTVANLETPVTEAGEPQTKEYVYRSSPAALPALREAGVDLVTLANNHSMDYGIPGLLDTMAYLDRAGIAYVGAGRNIDEAYTPKTLDIRGVRAAFVGLTRVYSEPWWQAGRDPGVAGTYDYRLPQALNAIRRAKSEADLVVVYVHWGVERRETPADYQRELARRYVDAGADLVVGSHPHVLQGFERYKGKWIAYSLGNFIFTVNRYEPTWDSMVLRATCRPADGSCALRVFPVSVAKAASPVPMEGEEALRVLRKLSALSSELGAAVRDDGGVEPVAAGVARD